MFVNIKLAETARYGLIFPLPYKHEWTLLYTYRVLIILIDKSSKKCNSKTKQNTKISMLFIVATPRRSTAKLRCRPSLRA